jgi:ATP-dependent Lhr-like helicase
MNSPASNSEKQQQSSSFFLLSEKVQRWIWEQGWDELRDAQEMAINPILECNTDILISASTASGKTEAAFLPICSVLENNEFKSVSALYLSPLKALINDQYDRLTALGEQLNVTVFKWHGDVSSSSKSKFLKKPSGILLITPESLEALFVLHGTAIKSIFTDLKYLVIDELHSFIGSERGRQLQSLMHRIETVQNRRIPRIGLSATLGDMKLAETFLRPNSIYPCLQIISSSGGQELRMQIRGYISSAKSQPPVISTASQKAHTDYEENTAVNEISSHLFATLRGSTNLVFANSRALTEVYSSKLRTTCDSQNIPNEFWPHHGSLSKQLREETEALLKDKSKPATAICTATLEMGIDIGSVKSIAQIGCPPTVASMRQRLGRSGRRGETSIMRIYIQELEISADTPPQDLLRAELFQSIAIVNLLLKGWCEPPLIGNYHFSTLVQQILSFVCQYGAIDALRTWRVLCETGPFSNVSSALFISLLREMGKKNLITQSSDGTIVLGWNGEKIVNNYDFYSAFTSPEEYKLFADGMILGTMPLLFPPTEDMFLIFAGRLWQITDIDTDRMTLFLKPAKSGKPPKFFGTGALISDEIRQEMFYAYCDNKLPKYLDSIGIKLFTEGVSFFSEMNLKNRKMLNHGDNTIIFPWCGDRILFTIYLLLIKSGLKTEYDGLTLTALNIKEPDLRIILRSLVENFPSDPLAIIDNIKENKSEKYDQYVCVDLLKMEFSAKNIDLSGAKKAIQKLIE